jgi:hypothetical protein
MLEPFMKGSHNNFGTHFHFILASWLAEWWGVIPVIYLPAGIRIVLIALASFSPLRGYKLNSKR